MTQTIQPGQSTQIHCDVNKRHDFAFLFDVVNGNPNGDPDAGNQPRVDPETMRGFVTDVCLKRKVRNWVDMMKGDEDRFGIYIKSRNIGLNDIHKRAHQAVFPQEANSQMQEKISGEEGKRTKDGKRGEKGQEESTAKESDFNRQWARRDWLCQHYYDIRTFGAVMSTGDYPSGQVRGPIQLTFASSVDPVTPLDIAITRVAVADIDPKKKTTSTMGRKSIIPYGLYLGYGFFVPHFAQQTGFSMGDLEIFWLALQSMWNVDRSAARGMMELRRLYVFSHNSSLGNAPAYRLFERISTKKADNVEVPRQISDYIIQIDDAKLPDGVVMTKLV